MTVRIEIHAEDGASAARELKMLADGLAIMGLVQQRVLAAPAGGALVGGGQPQPSFKQPSPEEIAEKMAADQQQRKAADPVIEPVTDETPKKRAGRKSKAEKEAEVAAEPVTEAVADAQTSDTVHHGTESGAPAAESTDANPNPYRLFDEDGKEEELFDTPKQYLTALRTMIEDAAKLDMMTLQAVGKANEQTMQRLQEEDVDFGEVLDLYKKLGAEMRDKAAAEAAPAPAAEAASTATPDLDAVRAAIKSTVSAKGVTVMQQIFAKFKATKASEVKEADRAAFIAECALHAPAEVA